MRLNVWLSDGEHAQLSRLAQRRGWSLSATAAVLVTLYLDEMDVHLAD